MKKLFIILMILAMATVAMAGESENLATQYGKLNTLKAYYETKLEKLVIDMSVIEKRFVQIRKEQMEKKADEKATADKPGNPAHNE